MSYPKQDSVARRLQEESLDALDAIRDKSWAKIERMWLDTRSLLRGFIMDTYRGYFGRERWNLPALKAGGGYHILMMGIQHRIDMFKSDSLHESKTLLNTLYKESILRHAWVLDQTTPPSMKVRIPHRMRLFEARGAVNYYTGAEATQQFAARWAAWTDGYASSLMTNIQMGALNESLMTDAADEVDATRVNTPSSGLLDALQRVFMFESALAQSRAIELVSQSNEEMDVEEIWETRRDVRVCEDCDANEGLPAEDADGDIPLHPNCNCYWRIVPAAWAELLRSGDDDAYKLAVDMDSKGLVPNTMAIRDSSGDIGAYTTVDFGGWLKDKFYAVGAQ